MGNTNRFDDVLQAELAELGTSTDKFSKKTGFHFEDVLEAELAEIEQEQFKALSRIGPPAVRGRFPIGEVPQIPEAELPTTVFPQQRRFDIPLTSVAPESTAAPIQEERAKLPEPEPTAGPFLLNALEKIGNLPVGAVLNPAGFGVKRIAKIPTTEKEPTVENVIALGEVIPEMIRRSFKRNVQVLRKVAKTPESVTKKDIVDVLRPDNPIRDFLSAVRKVPKRGAVFGELTAGRPLSKQERFSFLPEIFEELNLAKGSTVNIPGIGEVSTRGFIGFLGELGLPSLPGIGKVKALKSAKTVRRAAELGEEAVSRAALKEARDTFSQVDRIISKQGRDVTRRAQAIEEQLARREAKLPERGEEFVKTPEAGRRLREQLGAEESVAKQRFNREQESFLRDLESLERQATIAKEREALQRIRTNTENRIKRFEKRRTELKEPEKRQAFFESEIPVISKASAQENVLKSRVEEAIKRAEARLGKITGEERPPRVTPPTEKTLESFRNRITDATDIQALNQIGREIKGAKLSEKSKRKLRVEFLAKKAQVSEKVTKPIQKKPIPKIIQPRGVVGVTKKEAKSIDLGLEPERIKARREAIEKELRRIDQERKSAARAKRLTLDLKKKEGEGVLAKIRKSINETERIANENVTKAGVADAIRMRSPQSDISYIVTKSARTPGKWQATAFRGGTPTGHFIFDSKESAIKSISGVDPTGAIGDRTYKIAEISQLQKKKPSLEQFQAKGRAQVSAGKMQLGERKKGKLPPKGKITEPEKKPLTATPPKKITPKPTPVKGGKPRERGTNIVGSPSESVQQVKTLGNQSQLDVTRRTEIHYSRPQKVPSDPVSGVIGKTTSKAPNFKINKHPSYKNKRVSATDVMQSFRNILDVPIRFGSFPPGAKKRPGFYKLREEVIRIKRANDIPTTAHEIGHAINKAIMGWDGPQKLSLPMRSELEKLGKTLYGSEIPTAGYTREGLAEYIRYFITSEKNMKKLTPNFDKWFNDVFLKTNPEFSNRLLAAKATFDKFVDQGAILRSAAQIKFVTEKTAKFTKAKFKELTNKIYKRWVDEFRPFEILSKEASNRLGRELAISEDPFRTASALKLSHTARARYMVTQGMLDIMGNRVGPSLEEAVAIIKKTPKQTAQLANIREEFSTYLFARRALERWGKAKNPGISLEDAQFVFDQLDNPNFQLAAQKVYEWNRGILNYAAQGGLIDADRLVKILDGSEDYIPLHRVFDDVDMTESTKRLRGLGQGNPLFLFKGSGRRIKDPFQAMIENAEKIIRQTHERIVTNQIVRLANISEGLGFKIEKVPKDLIPKTLTIKEIKKQLIDAGADLTEADIDATITFFRPAQFPGKKNPIVPIRNPQGKIEWFEVDKELFDTLSGLEIYRLPKILDWIFGKPARAFRLGTTGLRPAFSLMTNWIRDLPTFLLQSTASNNPFKLSSLWLKQNADILRRTAQINPTANKYLDLFVRLGGEMAQPLGVDTRKTKNLAKEIFQGKVFRTITHPVEHARDILQIPEAATRTAELRALTQKIKWNPGDPLTFDQSLELLLQSKRVTTDFSSAGSIGKIANQIIPFFNPAIQGPRVFLRTFKRKPAIATIQAVSMLTVPTLLLWWQNKDKQWYKELPSREKFAFWNIEVNDKLVLRIPRPFEWGNFFSALPEAIVDTAYNEDPKIVGDVFKVMFENTVPDPLGAPLVNVSIEQLQNKTRFFKSPIVPRSQLDMPPEEQIGPYTTIVAEKLGEVLKLSPRRIDNVITNIFGGLGRDIAESVTSLAKFAGVESKGPEKAIREPEFADIPVAGRLFKRGGTVGTRAKSIEEIFNRFDAAYKRSQSKRREETPEQVSERFMLNDARLAIIALIREANTESKLKNRQELRKEAIRIAQQALKDVAEMKKLGNQFTIQ